MSKNHFANGLASVLIAASAFAPVRAFCDDMVLPALSGNMAEFEKQLKDHADSDSDSDTKDKSQHHQFGAIVSAEAKKVDHSAEKGAFGKWVSSQRKQGESAARPDESDKDQGQGDAKAAAHDSRDSHESKNHSQEGSGSGGSNSGSGSGSGNSRGHGHSSNGHGKN